MNRQQLLSQAYVLASSEHYDEALDLLNSDPLFQSDETAMELRARIFLEKGDKGSAKREWLNLLRIYPENKTAKEVLVNITGLRGWFWFQGKHLAVGLMFVAVVLGGFYTGQATRKPSPIIISPPVESGYAEFVISNAVNTLTTASLQVFLTTNKSEGKTLLVFSEHPITATIVSDMAVDFGFSPSNIICLPMKGNSSSTAVVRVVEGQYKEFRYDN